MIPDILKNTLMVGCGSFIGGAARYLVSISMKTIGKGFPWGTLVVNLIGCLAIGLLWGIFSKTSNEGNSWALFLMVGVCGVFTGIYASGRVMLSIRRRSVPDGV